MVSFSSGATVHDGDQAYVGYLRLRSPRRRLGTGQSIDVDARLNVDSSRSDQSVHCRIDEL